MYAGASWIKRSLKKEMSPLGEAVANLLGRVHRVFIILEPQPSIG
jgi:hypothetical protein